MSAKSKRFGFFVQKSSTLWLNQSLPLFAIHSTRLPLLIPHNLHIPESRDDGKAGRAGDIAQSSAEALGQTEEREECPAQRLMIQSVHKCRRSNANAAAAVVAVAAQPLPFTSMLQQLDQSHARAARQLASSAAGHTASNPAENRFEMHLALFVHTLSEPQTWLARIHLAERGT